MPLSNMFDVSSPSNPAPDRFDVAIIGAGVVGAAVAQSLSFFDLKVVLIDAASDVGVGTSKANSAILHTGFDADTGSLEAKLVRRGHTLLTDYAQSTGIPLERTGALVVAWSEADLIALDEVQTTAVANGYHNSNPLSVEAVYRMEPNLGPGVLGALEIPDESIVCPFTTPLALATEATLNGVTLLLNSPLTRSERVENSDWRLVCGRREIRANWVINTAGMNSDDVAKMLDRATFKVAPRRGQFIVFDKYARNLISHIILGVPGERSKGVLVAPTVFGHLLLGPTSEDLEDKGATETTFRGLSFLQTRGTAILPALTDMEVTSTYAGLRAVSSAGNYDIGVDAGAHYARAIGIRSTGLSASMAIAEYLLDELADAGLQLRPRSDHRTASMSHLGTTGLRPHCDPDAISANPDAGQVVCFCELVTLAELDAMMESTIPPVSLDGIRRRTRATGGRCQGFYCRPTITAWFDERAATCDQAKVDEQPW